MAKNKDKAWQFKVSLALSVLMLFFVFGYFTQSFLEIRKVKPVSVAIERLGKSDAESTSASNRATKASAAENNRIE